jgi:hypothetical protein
VLSALILRRLWNPLVLAVLSSSSLVVYLEEPQLLCKHALEPSWSSRLPASSLATVLLTAAL